MQQILLILSTDTDPAAISNAMNENSGDLHASLAPTVLIIDGDQNVRDALISVPGVIASLSDDEARAAVALADLTQLDVSGMMDLLTNTLESNMSFDEPTVLAVASWMYSFSQQYADKKSDRFRDGDTWNTATGCLQTDLDGNPPPNDEPIA